MSIALFIGRFQPFHNGHLWAIKKILKECDKIIIGIGSSQYEKTKINPYNASERKEMIEATLKKEDIRAYAIFCIPDIHHDSEWVQHVKKTVPNFDVVYSGSPLSKQLFTEKGFLVKSLSRHQNISASEVRLRLSKNMDIKNLVPEDIVRIIKHIGLQRLS